MRVIILGSGTGMPLNDRGSPSLVLIMDGEPVLFDMGPGSLRQLKRAGINPQDIRHIFLTLFHPDHTVDLISFLFATQNPSILLTLIWMVDYQ